MSKRSKKSDNSKRPQPLQQQRAQARQPAAGGSNKADTSAQPSSAPSREDGRSEQR